MGTPHVITIGGVLKPLKQNVEVPEAMAQHSTEGRNHIGGNGPSNGFHVVVVRDKVPAGESLRGRALS